MADKFMYGSSILHGSATTPGTHMPKELAVLIPKVLQECRDFGLDFYPTVVEMLTYDEMSEIAAYGGFPNRYPHWRWGMEYEELQRGYMYGQHRIYELVVNCLGFDTKVATSRGTISANEVVAGDIVYGKKGPREVAKVIKQKKQKLFRISFFDKLRTIECTGNHKWYVYNGQEYNWVETKDIRVGDYVLGCDISENNVGNPCKLNYSSENIVKNTRPNIRHCLKEINTPTEMSFELAELIGIILGDGSFDPSGNNIISVAVGLDFKYYANHVADLFLKVFGVEAKIYKKSNCYAVTLCSKIAIDFLHFCGINKGCTFDNKKIPWSIWNSSQDYRIACLRGLFDTDGCASKSISYSSKSKDLICDIELMLSELGIQTRSTHIKNRHNNIFNIKVKGRAFNKKFYQKIKLVSKQKIDGLKDLYKSSYCSNRGFKVSFLQNRIVELGKNIKSTQHISLFRSLSVFKKTPVGSNVLYSFCERALDCGFDNFSEVNDLLEIPHYEVSSIDEIESKETIDIALYHDDHDFVAEGMLSHNTNPCYIYCLNSNTLLDNVTVVAHATGHNHFFKNNIHFNHTNTNMLNEFANHGSRIRRYMSRWGKEKVGEFIDHLLRIETLIDPTKAWETRQIKDPIIRDARKYRYPKRIKIDKNSMYMDNWINSKEYIESQRDGIEKQDKIEELGLLQTPERDIYGWIKDNCNLKPWQADIMSMLYDEALYFAPQGATKVCNEAFASWTDYHLIAKQGLCALGQKAHDEGIVEYSIHKMGVLGGKYSTNPYKLGFNFLMDIEERWNKGRFGSEYEDCTDWKKKENWDLQLGLGKEKVFEVVRLYDDVNLINEFFTRDFCEKYEFFDWEKQPTGEYVIVSRDHKQIKKKLIKKYINRGLPDIRLVDHNHLNRGILLLEHNWSGRTLYQSYLKETLRSLNYVSGKHVMIATRNENGDEEVYSCEDGFIENLTRKQYRKAFGVDEE